MRSLKGWLALTVVVLGIVGVAASRAQADDMAFLLSSYDGNEQLNLATTNGPVSLNTYGLQGWWSGTATNSAGNTSYNAGSLGPDLYNNFFTFDVSPLDNPLLAGAVVTGASLSMTAALTYSTSGSPAEIYSAGSVSTPFLVLDNVGGPDAGIYADLGKANYGSVSIPISTPFAATVTVPLTLPQFFTDINYAINNPDINGGMFSIGGTVRPSAVTIPEPSALAALLSLCGVGVVGSVWRLRRRN
jgi:hypothetical protein